MTEASTSSKIPNAERYYTLTSAFEKRCSKIVAPSSSKKVSLEKLGSQFAKIQKSYARLAKSLTSRTEELQKLNEQHAKVQKLFFGIFAPRPEVTGRSSEKVHGLTNGGNNCAFNSLLQMITHAGALREALVTVPEFSALRKACAQYYGIKPSAVDSRQIRLMLANLFNGTFSSGSRFEDASEALNCMMSRVSTPILADRFAKTRVVRTYVPTGNSRAISTTIGRSAIEANTTTSRPELTPTIFVDPIASIDPRDRSGRIKLREADFQERLGKAFNSTEGGDNAYFLGTDPALEYEYRETRVRTVFDTMPNQLILTSRRYRGPNNANDTPMQMPRVLELPQDALANAEGVDRRLVLTSFVVFLPGHYISYVKEGNQWYCLDDSTATPVTTAAVDKVLYKYPSGGSYIHFYERGDADAEPPITPRPAQTDALSPEDAAITTLEQLKKLANITTTSNKTLVDLLKKLPQDVKNGLYHQIWDKEAKGANRKKPNIGHDLLHGNVRLLLKHKLITPTIQSLILKRDSALSQRELALKLCEAVNGGKGDRALELFGKLNKKYQSIAYNLLWEANGKKGTSAEEFSQTLITTEPMAALGAVIPHKEKSTLVHVADHILSAILDGEIRPAKTKTKAKPLSKSQYLELALKLSELITNKEKVATKDSILDLFKQLKSGHQSLVYKLIKMAKKPSKNTANFGKTAFEKDPIGSLDLKVNYNKTSQKIIEHLVHAIMDNSSLSDDEDDGINFDGDISDIDDFLNNLKFQSDDEGEVVSDDDNPILSDDDAPPKKPVSSSSKGRSGNRSGSSSSASSSSTSSSSSNNPNYYSDWLASVMGTNPHYNESNYDYKGTK